jgi:hypothetical protein
MLFLAFAEVPPLFVKDASEIVCLALPALVLVQISKIGLVEKLYLYLSF